MLIAGIGLGWAGSIVVAIFDEPERPLILQDLPDQTSEIEAAFSSRLQQEFPPGTPQNSLIGRLSAWGFSFNETEGRLWANYRTPAIVCQESYIVDWQLDASGNITGIDGGFHLSCL